MPKNKWIQLIVIYSFVTLSWSLIDPNSRSLDAVRIGELIGAGVGFLLVGLFISHIPATIVRFTSRSWPTWQIWLSVPCVTVAMFFAYLASSDQTIANQGSAAPLLNMREYWFSEEQCELAVSFPGRPTYRTNYGAGGLQIREAHYNTNGGFHLRAECTDYGGIWDGTTASAKDEDWIEWMHAFMSAEGFSNPQVSTEDGATTDHDLVIVDGRGYKTVGGIGATYRIRLLAADMSIMILYGAGPSSRFPSRDVGEFLESYQ